MTSKIPYKELELRVAELERLNNAKTQANTVLEKILNNILPICVTNKDYEIIFTNKTYRTIFGTPTKGMKCYESREGSFCLTEKCPLQRILLGMNEYTCEVFWKGKSGDHCRSYIVMARPLLDGNNKPVGVIESFQDITDRKLIEVEKKQLIFELQRALAKVKLLSGFLPICSSCKKIRDDKGYWNQIESYIRDHSEADFSHSICPECARKLYPDLVDDNGCLQKNNV